MSLVSPQWLHDHLSDPRLVILDATIAKVGGTSSGKEMTESIPGAHFFDLKGVFADKQSELPNTIPSDQAFTEGCQQIGINADSIIVIYDRLGIYASPRAWWLLKSMGHPNVQVLDGGFPAWQAAGYETSTSKIMSPERGDFVAKLHKDVVWTAEDILQNLQKVQAQVLDARSKGRFHAQEPEPRAGLIGGHIPGSHSLAFTEVLQDGKMRSPKELKMIFADLNLGDQALVFSCGSGITACIILLAATQIMDNPMAVYDGSWSEWGLPERAYPIDQ
ncbi:MAG: sulfurtransferase [Bacteroidota bacterium]